MLTSSCLSYDAFFPQSLGKQSLCNSIVDLVCSSVVQILPLQVYVWALTIRPLVVI